VDGDYPVAAPGQPPGHPGYTLCRMSTLIDRPVSARHRAGKIQVEMESGLEIAFPVKGNPRSEGKLPEQLDHIELSPFLLHWPDLDEDLSIRGILSGNYGQRPHRAA